MAITIKEIHVKTTIESVRRSETLNEEQLSRLKREILKEVRQAQQLKENWEKER